MTHSTVAILIPPHVEDIERFVAEQMAPYDENTQVQPYVCYSVDQAATDLANTSHRLELIISRNEQFYDIDKCRQNLDELRRMTPQQKYDERLQYFESFNDQGQPLSTYNPHSKWDWYVIGGRWNGWINDLETTGERLFHNIATTEEAIARGKIPYAIVTPDGKWHERGQMGWWAILVTENEDWDEQAERIFAQYPGHRIVIVDAHI